MTVPDGAAAALARMSPAEVSAVIKQQYAEWLATQQPQQPLTNSPPQGTSMSNNSSTRPAVIKKGTNNKWKHTTSSTSSKRAAPKKGTRFSKERSPQPVNIYTSATPPDTPSLPQPSSAYYDPQHWAAMLQMSLMATTGGGMPINATTTLPIALDDLHRQNGELAIYPYSAEVVGERVADA
jgi:hypothetical protein